MPPKILNCARCGEDATAIQANSFNYMVRVRRASKCKKYKPGQCGRTCKTEILPSLYAAIEEWNEHFAATTPGPATKGGEE
jgi:transcription elongation factor Elf1